jgi:hypothetical protein
MHPVSGPFLYTCALPAHSCMADRHCRTQANCYCHCYDYYLLLLRLLLPLLAALSAGITANWRCQLRTKLSTIVQTETVASKSYRVTGQFQLKIPPTMFPQDNNHHHHHHPAAAQTQKSISCSNIHWRRNTVGLASNTVSLRENIRAWLQLQLPSLHPV